MKQVLVLGAGRSSIFLIQYLLNWAKSNDSVINVADLDKKLAEKIIENHSHGKAFQLNALDAAARKPFLEQSDLVVSMLPARFHFEIVKDCVERGIPVITPSYLSDEIKNLDALAKEKGVLVLNELGVDPGIDHMSAMQFLDKKRNAGANFTGFESFTGGLVAPESDNNPWNYKFTWNPRNVVLAGQGGAVKFLHEGTYKYIPYHKLFRRTEVIDIPEYGKYEGYANRDSLKYRETYSLQNVDTIYRGTLRKKGFCKAWDLFVQLGVTDDTYKMEGSETMSYREFINSFLAYNTTDTVEMKLKHYLNLRQDDADLIEKIESLNLFASDKFIGIKDATPAQAFQKILEDVWTLDPEDKDMLVMWHKFNYEHNGKKFETESSMVCIGETREKTAMAKTVGLPLAIACKLILEDKLKLSGVLLPITPEIYNPILEELEDFGIGFSETTKELN